MNTFLAPIEQPKGLMKKLAYYFTRRFFLPKESVFTWSSDGRNC